MWPARRHRCAAIPIGETGDGLLYLGLMRDVKRQSGKQGFQAPGPGGVHHLLQGDQIGLELPNPAVDDLGSARIAFSVPDTEGQDAHAHDSSS